MAQSDTVDPTTTWGIPSGCREDTVLLDYCQEKSLEIITQSREELAAVLVEPFPTRHPELDPTGFLKNLDALARQSPFLLILDEMVSGFRLHPAGARGFLGIEANLVLYGKALSNGIPMAALAGQKSVMDLLDGGDWQFGDCSRPVLLTVPHGGTYHLHPLAISSMERVLQRLTQEGPALQEKLNRKTTALLVEVNRRLSEMAAPFYLAGWGSCFGPVWHNPEEQHWGLPLLYLHLLDQGVLLWGLTGFLSTAHSEKDFALLQEALCLTVSRLHSAGFWKAGSSGKRRGPP